MRFSSFFAAAATLLVTACGPTILLERADGSGGAGGSAVGGGGSGWGGSGGSGGSGWGGTGGSIGGGGTGGTGAGTTGGGTGAGASGGTLEWAKAFGADGHQHLHGLAVDGNGAMTVVGYFDGTLDLGAGPLPQTGLRSAFVARIGPKGKVHWSTSFTADDCAAEAVAVDGAGRVFVTGFVKGSLHVGDAATTGGDGIFVVALDPKGGLLWSKTFGSSANQQADRGLGVAASPVGLVVSGSYAGPLDLGGGPLPTGGAFVAGLDAAGGHLWSRALPGTMAVVGAGPDGRAVVGSSDTVSGSMWVQGFDASGAPTWSRPVGVGEIDAVTVSAAGDAYLAGSATLGDFGGDPFSSPLVAGVAFLASLDGTGAPRYSRALPFDAYQSTAVAVAVDATGSSAVAGRYIHHVDSSAVIQSAFLVTLDPGGSPLQSKTFGPIDGFGTSVTQEGWGIGHGPLGTLFFAGDFYTQIDVAGKSLGGDGTADLFVARLAL